MQGLLAGKGLCVQEEPPSGSADPKDFRRVTRRQRGGRESVKELLRHCEGGSNVDLIGVFA
jgi:hypothetical protein